MFSASKTRVLATLPMVQLRAPTQPPSLLQRRQFQTLSRHPSYHDGSNVLFKLQAPDTDDHGQPGLLGQVAVDACTIVAGDAIEVGCLHRTMATPRSIPPARCADVATISTTMPPTRYPHDRLLPHWQQLAPDINPASSSVTLAPLSCAMACVASADAVSSCRLRTSCLNWRSIGGRRTKCHDTTRAQQPGLTTRPTRSSCAPIYISLSTSLALLSCPSRLPTAVCNWLRNCLNKSTELEHLHHNRELHPTSVGVDMLYARFAWSVFTLLDAFVEYKIDRRLSASFFDNRLCSSPLTPAYPPTDTSLSTLGPHS
jgi:hypothetical protein